MTEKELLQAYYRQGDLAILAQLYTPYMSLIYGVCYKYFKHEQRSQDAVMQIFENLIKKLRLHEVDNFKSWLYTFSKNYCLMELRKDKRYQEEALGDYAEEPTSFTWEEQDFVRLEDCISNLNKEQQICIRYFYLEQRCYQDIALITGYDLTKVKSYIQNGKRNLKICMEKK